jgi:Fe2+ transport system protein FeoA
MIQQNQPAAPLDMCMNDSCTFEVAGVCTDECEARRLYELGFCVGEPISVVKAGDPAIVDVAGSRLALCGEIQRQLLVRPVQVFAV